MTCILKLQMKHLFCHSFKGKIYLKVQIRNKLVVHALPSVLPSSLLPSFCPFLLPALPFRSTNGAKCYENRIALTVLTVYGVLI